MRGCRVQVRRKVLGFALASSLFAQCAPQCAPAPSSAAAAWATFDRQLSDRLLGSGRSSAMSVTVSNDGTIVHDAAFGRRVAGGSELTAPSDRYRIASISKVLTSIAVLQLVEQGRLGIDQPVGWALAGHLGATPTDPRVGDITVRRLLAHTAGLGIGETLTFGGVVGSCPEAGVRVLSAALAYTPGTGYVYANLGYCLLALLVEQVTGRPYTAVVQDALLTPLGIGDMSMGSTYGTGPSDVWHWTRAGTTYMEVLWSAGAWLATSSDVVRIIDSLDPGKPGFHPLSAATTASMCQQSGFLDEPDRWYGLGLICFYGGQWGHTGTLESAHAIVLHRPDGITWSVLVSGNEPRETDDLEGIMNEVLTTSGVMAYL
jgi:D-alanyl-D-alanine carboxypeptidase